MHRVMTSVFYPLSSLVCFFINLSAGAENFYYPKEPSVFPSQTELSLDFDEDHALHFQWQAAPGATLYHLQERTEDSDHFVDLAANLPGDLLHYRMSPPLYGRSTQDYRVLSCNIAGCKPSNTLTLHHNAMINLVEWLPPQPSDLFGATLSLNKDGTVLAIGAPSSQFRRINNGSGSAGSVYLFNHSEGHWNPPVILKASSSTDRFGYPVQLDADAQVLTVGSRKGQRSLAHIFTRKGVDTWRRSADSPKFDDSPADYPALPTSLSQAGDVLAIASQYEFVNHPVSTTNNDPGQSTGPLRFVQIFERDLTGWQKPTIIGPSRYSFESAFGYAISLSGDGQVLAIGAPVLIDSDEQYPRTRGAVYLYRRLASGRWHLQETLRSTTPHNANFFGHSVSLNGNGTVLAIGSFERRGKTSSQALGSGLVQVFTRTASTNWQLNQVFSAPGDQQKTVTLANTQLKIP
ncbi:hypothetical protein ABMA57_00615 [Saccharospirillum sp. HFRX-1]|uniref:hypothetical protein n=1 Tax=unclassified Saccharospirillum TaxID=2633430 RepID=UPI0037189283